MSKARELIDEAISQDPGLKKAEEELYSEVQKLVSRVSKKHNVGRSVAWKRSTDKSRSVLEVVLISNQ